ncbi:uncharacterized protein [Watersipora subatra]|uniref:uncharacterized protein n=1 Tax=Watersipora subatra TaxID=2589382 RepID=UPI00355BF81C
MKKKYGYAIVNSGEKAIVYNLEGQARLVDGPQRIFLWREKIEMLKRFTASQSEYLIVKFRDGRVEHFNGPCSMFRVPTLHDTIRVRKAITLDAHEAIVVYRHNGDASERTVERHLIYGPKMVVPKSNEWLHTFCWHGVDPENKTRYIAASNKFTKLRLVPDQFYYNVDEIRTSDNGLVRVKLMIFHEIHDVNAMISATDDPIGDIISCICADVTSFTASRTYADFVESSAELNDLGNYPHLTTMCKASGIRVTKVVFRGYFAAPTIQSCHDEAIDKRTGLQLKFEKEQQSQEMQDRELSSERERIARAHQLEIDQLKQKQKLESTQEKHRLALEARKETDDLERKNADRAAQLAHAKAKMDHTIAHYEQLRSLGVDLTQYILNEAAIPEKVTKIVSGKEGRANPSPNIHFHMGSSNHNVAL